MSSALELRLVPALQVPETAFQLRQLQPRKLLARRNRQVHHLLQEGQPADHHSPGLPFGLPFSFSFSLSFSLSFSFSFSLSFSFSFSFSLSFSFGDQYCGGGHDFLL